MKIDLFAPGNRFILNALEDRAWQGDPVRPYTEQLPLFPLRPFRTARAQMMDRVMDSFLALQRPATTKFFDNSILDLIAPRPRPAPEQLTLFEKF